MASKRTRAEETAETASRKRPKKEDDEDETEEAPMAVPKAKAKRAAPKRGVKDLELTESEVINARAAADELLASVHPSWQDFLEGILKGDEGCKVLHRLAQVKKGKKVFPPTDMILRAFALTSFEDTKVVILGQDPYHREGQAMGLAFSVPDGVTVPPSLKKIYEEAGLKDHKSGDLTTWASQGVLLLNPVLTVEAGKPNAHEKVGWKAITDAVLQKLSESHPNSLVFMLWGQKAQAKAALLNDTKHLVLKAAHPSPLATKGGFVGCGHFKQCNEHLVSHGQTPVDWRSVLQMASEQIEEQAEAAEVVDGPGAAEALQANTATLTQVTEALGSQLGQLIKSNAATIAEESVLADETLSTRGAPPAEMRTEPALSHCDDKSDLDAKEAMTEPALPHYEEEIETEPTDSEVKKPEIDRFANANPPQLDS